MMEQVFSYIIGLGAAVMMPIIFTILGICIGIKFGKALKSGLLVGVGFVGLSVVTALLTSSLGSPLKSMSEIYHLQLGIFDMGWPAAASVAYNTTVGAFIIPVCLGINIILLLVRATKTINIDLWNYWHYAFIGAVVFFATNSIWYGFLAAIRDHASHRGFNNRQASIILQRLGWNLNSSAVLPRLRAFRRSPELGNG